MGAKLYSGAVYIHFFKRLRKSEFRRLIYFSFIQSELQTV